MARLVRRVVLPLICAVVLTTGALPAFADPVPAPSATSSPSPTESSTASPAASPSPSPSESSSPTAAPTPGVAKKETPIDAARKGLQGVGDAAPGGAVFTGDTINRTRIQAVIESLDSQISALSGRVSELFARTTRIQAELDRVEQRVAAARAAAEGWAVEFKRDTARFYMSGAWETSLPAMNSRDVNELATARVYMHGVLDTVTGLIDRFRGEARRLESERRRSSTIRRALDAQIAERESELRRLAALRSRKQAMLGGVLASFGVGSSAISSLIEAAQESQAVAAAPARYVLSPVAGHVSSPFGWRVHPIYGYRSFHTGVDLAVPAGTPIRAARDGEVLEVALIGPFGLATVIDDGSEIATVYAHQSFATVRRGDRVKQGQVIGLVGCTGWCTGPHLHFEVWFRGHPVDPVPWLAVAPGSPLVRLA